MKKNQKPKRRTDTKIKVDKGAQLKLAEIFKCDNTMISKALSGTLGNNAKGLTPKIRHTALTQFGGVEYEQPKRVK